MNAVVFGSWQGSFNMTVDMARKLDSPSERIFSIMVRRRHSLHKMSTTIVVRGTFTIVRVCWLVIVVQTRSRSSERGRMRRFVDFVRRQGYDARPGTDMGQTACGEQREDSEPPTVEVAELDRCTDNHIHCAL